MTRRLLLSLFLVVMTSFAVDWGDYTEGDIHWGESLYLEDYRLVVADFTPEEATPWMVMLNLYSGGELIASRALEAGENFSIDDKVMVSVEEIKIRDYLHDENIEPTAKVRLQVRALPKLDMHFVTDDDSYEAGEYIEFELAVVNVGDVKAEDIDVVITSKPPFVEAKYSKSGLRPGEEWDEKEGTEETDSIRFRTKAPYLPGPVDFEVTAHARYLDAEGDPVQSWAGTSFGVFGPLKLNKYVEDEQNFGDEIYAHLSLRNTGNRTLKVKLTDSVGRDFQTTSPLEWYLEMPPGDAKTVSYKLSAETPGEGQVLPSAEAVYDLKSITYKVSSESPAIDIIGPLVEAKKKASSRKVELGEEVIVTLDATNVGNRRTKVSIEETIPDWAEFVSGATEISKVLLPGETISLEYIISCDEAGKFEIPPTKICYRNYEGLACILDSSRLKITVEGKAEEIEKKDTVIEISDVEERNTDDESEDLARDVRFETDVVADEGDTEESSGLLLWTLFIVALFFVLFNRYV